MHVKVSGDGEWNSKGIAKGDWQGRKLHEQQGMPHRVLRSRSYMECVNAIVLTSAKKMDMHQGF